MSNIKVDVTIVPLSIFDLSQILFGYKSQKSSHSAQSRVAILYNFFKRVSWQNKESKNHSRMMQYTVNRNEKVDLSCLE